MRQMARSARLAVTTLVATALMASAALANEIIIVLDGSGSSAGQIGGVAKIDIARGALRSVLVGAPDNLSIGLVAYGHRQEEACSDIELVAPPGTPDAFIAAADTVRSVGRSPIAEATAAAAAAIADPDNATIIVITDNADNCAPDPCATISAIHDEMPGLTISVLGIAIPENEVTEISCFADITGGLYLRAANAAGFEANLDQAFSAALVDPLPPLPTAAITLPVDVVQSRAFNVTYRGPLAEGDEIRIAWLGSPPHQYVSGAHVRSDGSPVALTAPAEIGAFELRYWHAERGVVLARVPLRIAALAPALDVAEEVQQGGNIVVTWHADQAGGRTIQVAEPNTPLDAAIAIAPVIRGESTVVLPAPGDVGTYEVRLVAAPPTTDNPPEIRGNVDTRILARATIRVVAANIRLDVDAPILAGGDFQVDWTGPGGENDQIRLARPSMDAADFIAVAVAIGDSVSFRAPVPAGPYELRYYSAVMDKIIATAEIDVAMPTATLDAPETIAGGVPFEVNWTGPAASGDRIVVLRSTSGGNQILASQRVPLFGQPVTFDAPIAAGTYGIAYLGANGELALVLRQIAVSTPIVEFDAPPTAEVGARIGVAWDGPGGQFDELRLIGPDTDQTVISATRLIAGADAVLTAPDEPGLYRIVYWAGSARSALMSAVIEITCSTCAAPPAPEAELRLEP